MKGETQDKKVLVRGKGVFIGVMFTKKVGMSQHGRREKKSSMGVFQANIMRSKGFLITSRIVRSK